MEPLAHCEHIDPTAAIWVRSFKERLRTPTVYDPSTVGGADRQRQAEPVLGNSRELFAEPCPLHRIGARLDHQASADPRLTLTAGKRRRHAGDAEGSERGAGRWIRHVLRRYLRTQALVRRREGVASFTKRQSSRPPRVCAQSPSSHRSACHASENPP
jgi:hypothetical protein